jgi:hypothetical protein
MRKFTIIHLYGIWFFVIITILTFHSCYSQKEVKGNECELEFDFVDPISCKHETPIEILYCVNPFPYHKLMVQ